MISGMITFSVVLWLILIMAWLSWHILLKVLPLTILFGGLKLGMHWRGWEPWTFDSLTGSLLGAATFALTIVLSSTLSDYRASELMPLIIVNALETIQDSNMMVAKSDAQYDHALLQTEIVGVVRSILAWLQEGKPFAAVEQQLDQLNGSLALMRSLEDGLLVIHRIQIELSRVRLTVRQMQSVRDADFVPAAYTLLILFITASTVCLLLISADSFSESLVISMFLFTSLIYFFVFIRDLDDPFEYTGNSGVDVDLSCLEQLRDRLK
jgi:hypothetical protein